MVQLKAKIRNIVFSSSYILRKVLTRTRTRGLVDTASYLTQTRMRSLEDGDVSSVLKLALVQACD